MNNNLVTLIAGLLRDVTKDYTVSFVFSGSLTIFGSFLFAIAIYWQSRSTKRDMININSEEET